MPTTQKIIHGLCREANGLCSQSELYHVDGIGYTIGDGWTPLAPSGETTPIKGWGSLDTDNAMIFRSPDLGFDFLASDFRSEAAQ